MGMVVFLATDLKNTRSSSCLYATVRSVQKCKLFTRLYLVWYTSRFRYCSGRLKIVNKGEMLKKKGRVYG